MKKLLAVLISAVMLVAALTVAVSAEEKLPSEYEAQAVYGTPTIDGEVDNIWDNAQLNRIENFFADDGITEHPQAKFRIMYDEFYLYILVEVNDPTMGDLDWEKLSTGGNLWKRDAVSFTFAPDYNRDITDKQEAPAFWYIIGAYGTTANWNGVPAGVFLSEELEFVPAEANDLEKFPHDKRMYAITYKTDASGYNVGYTMECKINLKLRYDALKLEPGTKIGFDIYLNDNNNILLSATRNIGLTWTGDVNSYKNNSVKGTILLADKNVAFEQPVETVTEAPVTTEAPVVTTEAPVVTTEAPVVTTEAPVVTTAAPADDTTAAPADVTTAAPAVTTEAPAEKKGRGSSTASVMAAVAVLGCAVVFKKH
ncbi:MAG: hypothetical protein MJ137_00860 [Clostridia bacterium]|nr:hypothetical protein [Clostridia bacterium]